MKKEPIDPVIGVKDGSKDRSYFTITPRLVFYKSRTPYDFALWVAIKDIAGEEGECYLSTPELAALAMMSAGQVHKSREFLISQGLLAGQVRKDPGYPQPVWHLRVPDLWSENITFCKANAEIKTRLALRAAQQEVRQAESAARKEAAGQAENGEHSPGESLLEGKEHSPGEKGTTPSEKGTTPGEKGTTPSETKNIQKKTQEENPEEHQSAAQAPRGGLGSSKPTIRNQGAYNALAAWEAQKAVDGNDYSDYPEDTRAIIEAFCRLWNMKAPAKDGRKNSEYKKWISQARGLRDACSEIGLPALEKAYERWHGEEDPGRRLMITQPLSVTGLTRSAAALLRESQSIIPDGSLSDAELEAGWAALFEGGK